MTQRKEITMNAYSETSVQNSTGIPSNLINGAMPPMEPDTAPDEIEAGTSAILDREPLTRALYVAMAAIERRNSG
jgi:hypothetical protein